MTFGSAFVDNCDPLDDSVSCTGRTEGTTYANWDAFATATPDHRIGHAIPFVITDTPEPGTTLVFAIDVSK